MTPLRSCLVATVVALCAGAPVAETVGGAGLRSKPAADGPRLELRVGSGIGPLALLEPPLLIGGADRFHLLGALDKPSLSPGRRGPALGEARSALRDREWTQLRRELDAPPAAQLRP
jgi:hypothetical protein